MGDENSISGKLSCVVFQLSLGEKIHEVDVVAKFLQATPTKYDSFTSSLEKFGDIDSMPL